MASTAGIRCGGAMELRNQRHRLVLNTARSSPPVMLRFSPRGRISAAAAATMTAAAVEGKKTALAAENLGERRTKLEEEEECGIEAESLEEWMRESVTEIVKSLSAEGPLLVHVFADEEGRKRLEKEEGAEEGDWRRLSEKWRKREAESPEGVIFVERIHDGEEEVAAAAEEWGVVVQGRGARCGPVCYLLKTSRVGSGAGMGCTHFCLMRVRSFRETARSQLKNCWLLQAQYCFT
ncbi:hypothetical protein LINGRAHAP2_LOCUS33766 [Linum grandiflorum]